jgi:hypothetical protein
LGLAGVANVFQGLSIELNGLNIELNQEYYPFMTTWLREKGLLVALFTLFLAWQLRAGDVCSGRNRTRDGSPSTNPEYEGYATTKLMGVARGPRHEVQAALSPKQPPFRLVS